MLEKARKLLAVLERNGFESYIVGGYVRDFYLGKESLEADIATAATPLQIRNIFKNDYSDSEEYGTSIVFFAGTNFHVTTFRIEKNYEDFRRPKKVKYVKSFVEDLKRRDFTVNTLAIDVNGCLVDHINGINDLMKKQLRTVGNPYLRFQEDPLRILRAIRFAAILDLRLDENVIKAIVTHKELLKKISFTRKKEELNKIFISPNISKGLKIIKDLKLESSLDISFTKVKPTNDILGIWSQIEMDGKYPFTKNEKEIITAVKDLKKKDLFDPYILYSYDLYALTLSSESRGIDRTVVSEKHKALPIKSRKDIVLDSMDICELLNRTPGEFLKEIYKDLEMKILYGQLKNNKRDITKYLKSII